MSLGILCPGQGAQTAEMLVTVHSFPESKPALEALQSTLGLTVADIGRLPASELHKNQIAQPLICAYELALWAILAPRLPEPRAFAGYSVGELAAHGCAGTLSAPDTIKLASERARLMDACCNEPSAMLAVRGLPRHAIDRHVQAHGVAVAIVNGADRFVLGGPLKGIYTLADAVLADGASITRLQIYTPSHTPLLAEASGLFSMALSNARTGDPRTAILSGLDGQPVTTAERARNVLAAQISNSIDWSACLNGLAEQGCRVLLELGCGSDLSRMASDALPGVQARSISDFRSIDAALAWAERLLSE
jgi:[acyl-carrier-protein] S-malonyltransferase